MSEDQVKCIYNSRICGEFFSIGLQVAMTTCTNPSSGVTNRIHTQALSEERTGEDGDVKSCSRVGIPSCDEKLRARDSTRRVEP